MKKQQKAGRVYRKAQKPIEDWKSFKESWKSTDWIEEVKKLTEDQLQTQLQEKLNELVEDSKKMCYLFPNALEQQLRKAIVKIVEMEFDNTLYYEYESLYMNKEKQLLVYKSTSSMITFVSKYRLPDDYKKQLSNLSPSVKEYEKLIVKRNILISEQLPEELEKINKEVRKFEDENYNPKMNKFLSLMKDIINDFKAQKGKQTIPIFILHNFFADRLKQLAEKEGLFFHRKNDMVSQYFQYKDYVISKDDQALEQIEDIEQEEENRNSSEKEEQIETEKQNEKSKVFGEVVEKFDFAIKETIPQNINYVKIEEITKDGIQCTVSIHNFSQRNKTQLLVVTLLSPRCTPVQQQYKKIISIQEGKYDYSITLDALNYGFAEYLIKARNVVGQSREGVVMRVWNETKPNSENEKGFFQIQKKNHSMYMLGKTESGLIPNPQNSEFRITTDEKWQKVPVSCEDFSVSSHVAVCNKVGDVAAWGCMFVFDTTVLKDEESDEEDCFYGDLKHDKLKMQKPSLILQNQFIRKVSCGEGYCLMASLTGRAWSFGLNIFGQLGLDHFDPSLDTTEPSIIPYFENNKIFITDVIASNFGGSFAIDHEGKGYRWGAYQVESTQKPIKNSYEDIINFQYSEVIYKVETPMEINKKHLGDPIKEIHPGMNFVLVLTKKDELYGWGEYKHLAQEQSQLSSVCNPIPIMKHVKQVAVGYHHCLVENNEGEVYGWGQSKYFKHDGSQFVHKPEILNVKNPISLKCGGNLSLFQTKADEVEVVCKALKEKVYTLPFKNLKGIRCGEEILVAIADQE